MKDTDKSERFDLIERFLNLIRRILNDPVEISQQFVMSYLLPLERFTTPGLMELLNESYREFSPIGKRYPFPGELAAVGDRLSLKKQSEGHQEPLTDKEAGDVWATFEQRAKKEKCSNCHDWGFCLVYYELSLEFHYRGQGGDLTQSVSQDKWYMEHFDKREQKALVRIVPLMDFPKPRGPNEVGFVVRCDCDSGKRQHKGLASVEDYREPKLEFV